MRHLDLFSGIGGFALGLRMAGGFETVQFVEIEPFAQKVLAKNFPGVPIHADIRSFRPARGSADIITGGFPCQPFSAAGKQLGTADDRDLWPEMRRVIEAVRPAWIIGENVAGFVNMELDRSLSDLEALGYACRAFVVPACATDAPHRRDRVWIVAHTGSAGLERYAGNGNDRDEPGRDDTEQDRPACPRRLLPGGWREVVFAAECDPEGDGLCPCGFDYSDGCSQPGPTQDGYEYTERDGVLYGRPEETGALWLPEPGVGRVAHGIPRRVDRLRGLGNAVVPQVVCEIAKAILATERLAA